MWHIPMIRMDPNLETIINQYDPIELTLVDEIKFSGDDIDTDSKSLKFEQRTGKVCGYNVDCNPGYRRKVWFISAQHPKRICLELKRIGRSKYVLKGDDWKSVVQAEDFRVDDEVILWAFTDGYKNELHFAMHRQECCGSNF